MRSTPSVADMPSDRERDPVFGCGAYLYRCRSDWAKLPAGWSFSEVSGVGVDSDDNVYVFSRSDHPVVVFDRDGNFLRSWGEGLFVRPHAIHVGPDDSVYCTDDGDHTVRKFTREGRLQLTLGVPGRPSPFMSGLPFHRCTHTALSPGGEIYVSDGYGNACVHRFAPDGRHLESWGGPGTGPGEFNVAHNICCDLDGWVYVADRENHRIQIFDRAGRYEAEWRNLHRPNGLFLRTEGGGPTCYVGEGGPVIGANRGHPNLGPRVSIMQRGGTLRARFGELGAGQGGGTFLSPHGIAVDSRGDIYVGEVVETAWPKYHAGKAIPEGVRSLHKFTRLD